MKLMLPAQLDSVYLWNLLSDISSLILGPMNIVAFSFASLFIAQILLLGTGIYNPQVPLVLEKLFLKQSNVKGWMEDLFEDLPVAYAIHCTKSWHAGKILSYLKNTVISVATSLLPSIKNYY